MYTSFSNLPEDARIWIYQSNRYLDDAECEIISARLLHFMEDWCAHEQELLASFSIIYNRFIVIGVDERQTQLTGCSIDKSVRIMQEMQSELGLEFFDRMQVAFRSRKMINGCSLAEFKKMMRNGDLSLRTKVFNNMVRTKAELLKKWEVPVSESWHFQYVK